MKGVMLVCVILALLVSSPAQSQTLFDDFTGPLLDSGKWYGDYKIGPNISNYLEIGQVIAKGKLDMFNHCLGSTEDGDTGYYSLCDKACHARRRRCQSHGASSYNPLVLSIRRMQRVTNDSGGTWIRIGGAFFNSTPITGTVDESVKRYSGPYCSYAGMQIPPIPPVF